MPVLHRARLCKICRWDDYQGYGFSLHATRGKIGHFIGDVDPQSPAFAGGVRDNDFVVEVNGINVLSDPHQQVVDRIKQLPDQVTLLVLDREARKYFEEQNVVVDSYMEALERIDCPASNPHIHSGPMDTKEDTYHEITSAPLSAVSEEKGEPEQEEEALNADWAETWKNVCEELESHALAYEEGKQVLTVRGSHSPLSDTVTDVADTQLPNDTCADDLNKVGHVQHPSVILEPGADQQQAREIELHVIKTEEHLAQCKLKSQHLGDNMVQEHVTEEVRSSTRIEIIREPEALQASKAESNHERTIILLHSSTDGSQLRDSTNRDSTREPHANGASFAEPEVRKQSVGPRENGHYSNASTILIETVPQSDRRENLRSTSRETQQSPIESRPPRVNSVGLDERSNSVSRSERSIKSDTLDSPRPLSDVTNGDRLDEDLMAVKMKCATRSRKNRLPASTFAERKKMFDQL